VNGEGTGEAANKERRDGPPRGLLIAAVAVGAAAIIIVLTIAAIRQSSPQQQPVAIAAVPAPQANSTECQSLMAALPDQLGDFRRAPTVQPTPESTAAWQAAPGGEPVILRCGVERPSDFMVGSPLQVVDGVQWFRAGETSGEAGPGEAGRSTWYAVDRPVYVALTLPGGSGPTPIQVISDVIAATIPAKPIDPAPPR
jgi:hypothetical protein